MTYPIDTNIPLYSRSPAYPFDELEVGDSFFVPAGEGGLQPVRNRLNPAIARYRRKHPGRRFATRAAELYGQEGIRIWRVE